MSKVYNICHNINSTSGIAFGGGGSSSSSSHSSWTTPNKDSGQSCLNQIGEEAGFGAIGGAIGGPEAAAAGAALGALHAIAESAECKPVRD